MFPTCTEPEAVNLLGACDVANGIPDTFGSLSGGCLVTVACGDGYRALDLTTGATVFGQMNLSTSIGASFGTIGVEDDAGAALFTFGASGNGFCTTAPLCRFNMGPTTFDAFPAGGDPATGEAVVVGPATGVQFIARGFGDSDIGFGFRPQTIAPSAFEGEPVSGWMPSTGGTAPFLLLTRAVNSFLYEVEGPTPNAFPLNVGLDARRIRCADVGNGSVFCGVSVFGNDRVALVLWTITNAPQLRGFIDVGDGPVGLDIRALPSGNFALVSTGFNNNSITETEVSASAGNPVISTQTRLVPSGCMNPGHAAYVEDGMGLKIVGTCFGSDNAFVQESRF